MTSKVVKKILANYGSDNPGTLSNIAKILNHGKLGGTGKMVILPVDQGFEHGPARSFSPNPPGYDPLYHFELAIEAGFNAYAAPLGFIEAGAREYPDQIPLILKTNNADALWKTENPLPAITSTVEEALRLGCNAVGFTIYPGSSERNQMYEQFRLLAQEAKEVGLAVVLWSYPRGESLSKEGETAVDVVAYAAQIASQLGAHIIKVKPPSKHIELNEAKRYYEEHKIPIDTLADRVKHVMESAFNKRRLVVFSGGPAKKTEDIMEEVRAIAAGGGSGSIIGRNSFQRDKKTAIEFIGKIIDIYKNAE
ncbi:MAG: class I fructose-bisphosphate aldolase [Candidatus Thorarchaeota archaeon]